MLESRDFDALVIAMPDHWHAKAAIMGLQAGKAGVDFTGCYAEVGECEEDMQKFVVTRIPITFHLKASYDAKLRAKLESFAHRACFVGNTLTAEKAFTFIYE